MEASDLARKQGSMSSVIAIQSDDVVRTRMYDVACRGVQRESKVNH